jgi:hypothetical protein
MLHRHLAGQASVLPRLARRRAILHADSLRLLAHDLAVLDAFDPVRPRLLALGAHLDALGALRARLLAFGPHLDAFGALRARLLAFDALGTFSPLGTFGPLRTFCLRLLRARLPKRLELGARLRGPGAGALGLRSLPVLALMATRTRRGRH